jgi:hypothetical protein
MIKGNTVAEVKASLEAAKKAYAGVKSDLLKEQGAAVPSANGGGGAAPVPSTPFGMIVAGVSSATPHRGGSK